MKKIFGSDTQYITLKKGFTLTFRGAILTLLDDLPVVVKCEWMEGCAATMYEPTEPEEFDIRSVIAMERSEWDAGQFIAKVPFGDDISQVFDDMFPIEKQLKGD